MTAQDDDTLRLARHCADVMMSRDAASKALGISIEIPDAGTCIARMRVRADMVNGFDVCHGGLIFSLADTAFAFACNAHNRVSVAASANIDFLRPAKLHDVLTATAREQQVGKSGGVYVVDIVNQAGTAVALFRGRSASRADALVK